MRNEKIPELSIYTDGSCIGDIYGPRYGGWAWVFVYDNKEVKHNYGYAFDTTNQRMELLAAANALEEFKKNDDLNTRVTVYTDSAYLYNCWRNRWVDAWRRNGWQNSKGEDVKNSDLWWRLIPFFDNTRYTFVKVKGHANDMFNNMVDKYATTASKLCQEHRDIELRENGGK